MTFGSPASRRNDPDHPACGCRTRRVADPVGHPGRHRRHTGDTPAEFIVIVGVTGALRQYRRLRHAAVTARELHHQQALTECRDLLMRCYPPRQPRARRPPPQPQVRGLSDVVFDEHPA